MGSRGLRLTEWVAFRVALLGLFLVSAWGVLVGYGWAARRVRAEVEGSGTVLMVLLGLVLVALAWAAMEIEDWHEKKRGGLRHG